MSQLTVESRIDQPKTPWDWDDLQRKELLFYYKISVTVTNEILWCNNITL